MLSWFLESNIGIKRFDTTVLANPKQPHGDIKPRAAEEVRESNLTKKYLKNWNNDKPSSHLRLFFKKLLKCWNNATKFRIVRCYVRSFYSLRWTTTQNVYLTSLRGTSSQNWASRSQKPKHPLFPTAHPLTYSTYKQNAKTYERIYPHRLFARPRSEFYIHQLSGGGKERLRVSKMYQSTLPQLCQYVFANMFCAGCGL